jgi:hypothetical protein
MCVVKRDIFSPWNLFSVLETSKPSVKSPEISLDLSAGRRFDHNSELLANHIENSYSRNNQKLLLCSHLKGSPLSLLKKIKIHTF